MIFRCRNNVLYFDMYKKELEELPVKGESNKKNQTPTDTSEPVATEEPQEEE